MAIASRATDTLAFGTARTTTTLNKPAGTVSGDVMYAHLSVGNTSGTTPVTVTPPSGFTQINADLVGAGGAVAGYQLKMRVYRKVAGGSEPSTYSWTHASADTEGFLESWSGVDNVTPEDKAVVENSAAADGVANSGKTITLDAGTAVTNGAQVVMCDTNWDASGAGSYSGTTPTLTTELTGTILKVASGNLATAGATGSRTRTNGNAGTTDNEGWMGVAYVIRPASGAAAASLLPFNQMQHQLNQLLSR